MKSTKSILKNEYIFSLLSKGLMVFIGLAESALLARYLGPDLRGSIAYIYSVASSVYLVMTFGIYTAYPFLRKKAEKPIRLLINEFMTIVSVLFLGYFIICFICGFVLWNTHLTLSLIFLMLPFMGYDKIVSFVCMIEKPNRTNFISLLTNIIQCFFLICCFCFSSRVIYVGIVFYIIGCVIRSVYFSKKLAFRVNMKLFNIALLFKYMRFGLFPMIALLLTTLNYRLDVIMLKHYSYIAISQIGIYSIGMGLSEKCLLIPDAVKEVLLSRLAKGKNESEVAKVMRVCFLASILTAILIQFLGKVIIDVLYGLEYEGAETVTYISVWGTTFMVFFKMISQYNVVQHRQRLNVVFLLISIIANFVLNILLIPSLGINGAAVATVVGYLVSSAVFLLYFKKVSGIPIYCMIFIQKSDLNLIRNIYKKS